MPIDSGCWIHYMYSRFSFNRTLSNENNTFHDCNDKILAEDIFNHKRGLKGMATLNMHFTIHASVINVKF